MCYQLDPISHDYQAACGVETLAVVVAVPPGVAVATTAVVSAICRIPAAAAVANIGAVAKVFVGTAAPAVGTAVVVVAPRVPFSLVWFEGVFEHSIVELGGLMV